VDSRGRSVHRERGSRHRAKPCVCVAAMGLGRAGRVTSLGFTNRALLLTDRLIQRIFRVGTNPAFAPTGDEGAGSRDRIHQPDITVADPKESELLVSLGEERAQRRRCPCRDSPARLKMRAIARSAGHPKRLVTSRREFGLQARISGRVEIRRGGESVRIVRGHNHEVLGQGAGALRPEVSVRESGGKIRHGDEATMITAGAGAIWSSRGESQSNTLDLKATAQNRLHFRQHGGALLTSGTARKAEWRRDGSLRLSRSGEDADFGSGHGLISMV